MSSRVFAVLCVCAACASDAAPAGKTASPATTATMPSVAAGTTGTGTAGASAAGSVAGAAGASAAGGGGTGGTGVSGSAAASGTGVSGSAAASGTGAGASAAAGSTAMPSFMPGSPTFSAVFQEIIVGTGCNAGGTCHGSTVAGQLKMSNRADTYTALVGKPAMGVNLPAGGTDCRTTGLVRVTPGDPENSLIVKKVSDAMVPCGQSMPPGGKLKPEQIAQIKQWISDGAADD